MSLFICSHCNDERKNNRSLKAHERYCKYNPNRSYRDYSHMGYLGNLKSRITKCKKIETLKTSYENNPTRCKNCDNVIEYDKRKNVFCSKRCSGSYNNKKRDCKPGPIKGTPNKIKVGETSFPRKVFNDLNPKYVLHRKSCTECSLYFWTENKKKKTCSEKCKSAIFSKTAKNNPKMGGNKNKRAYGWYISNSAGKVWLESSWEYKVAASLDANDVKWERPKFLTYGNKKYFPDFYLSDYDVYLDPKNSYLRELDAQKIQLVQEQNDVLIILLDECQLEWGAIKNLINAP